MSTDTTLIKQPVTPTKSSTKLGDHIKRFAHETPINGIKELFLTDAVLHLKVLWALFLLISAGVMIAQIVSVCTDYRKELTVTTVTVEDIPANRSSTLTLCIDLSTKLNLLELNKIQSIPRSRMNTSIDYRETVLRVLTEFGIDKLHVFDIRASAGFLPNVWCLVTLYNKAQSQFSDIINIVYNRSEQHNFAFGLYTFTSMPFKPATSHAIKLSSSQMKNTKWELSQTGYYVRHNSTNLKYYDSATSFHIKLKKYIFPNLRRRPCAELPERFQLPIGRGEEVCHDSCMMNAYYHAFNCVFRRHLNVFRTYTNEKYCHWFDMMDQIRAELEHNCSTGKHVPSIESLNVFYKVDEAIEHSYYSFVEDPETADDAEGSTMYNDFEYDLEYDYFKDYVKPDPDRIICDIKMNYTGWTNALLYLIEDKIKYDYPEGRWGAKQCKEQCKSFKPCVEWEAEFTNFISTKTYHTFNYETISLAVSEPKIMMAYEEKLQATLDDLIGNIGGIFGFYFGFSVVAMVHVIFFILYTIFNNKSHKYDGHNGVEKV